jgi:hypothetical protein
MSRPLIPDCKSPDQQVRAALSRLTMVDREYGKICKQHQLVHTLESAERRAGAAFQGRALPQLQAHTNKHDMHDLHKKASTVDSQGRRGGRNAADPDPRHTRQAGPSPDPERMPVQRSHTHSHSHGHTVAKHNACRVSFCKRCVIETERARDEQTLQVLVLSCCADAIQQKLLMHFNPRSTN